MSVGAEKTHILVSLEEAPPAIFWTRRLTSSFFNSSSCLVRSSLLFGHNCAALTPGCRVVDRQHFVLPSRHRPKFLPIPTIASLFSFDLSLAQQEGGIVRTMASIVEGVLSRGSVLGGICREFVNSPVRVGVVATSEMLVWVLRTHKTFVAVS